MDLNAEELALKAEFDRFIVNNGYIYYPDEALVESMIKALAMRKRELGEPYCTCRLVTGNAEIDSAIACPCKFVDEEIEKNGYCHCMLFAAADYGKG